MKAKFNQNKNNGNQGGFKSKNKARKEIKYGSNKNATDSLNVAKKNQPKFPNNGKANQKGNIIVKQSPKNKKGSMEISKGQKPKKKDVFNKNFSEDDSDELNESDVSESDMIQFSAEEGEESDLEGEESDLEGEESDLDDEEGESGIEDELDVGEEGSDDSNEEGSDDELDFDSDEDETDDDAAEGSDDDDVVDENAAESDDDVSSKNKKSKKGQQKNQKIEVPLKKNQKIEQPSKKDQKSQINQPKNDAQNKQVKTKPIQENKQAQLKQTKGEKQIKKPEESAVGKANKRKANADAPTPTKKVKLLKDDSPRFVAIIKSVPKSLLPDDVKSALGSEIPVENVLSVKLKPNRRRKDVVTAIISLSDDKSLQAIVSKEYNINGETYTVLQGSTVEERLSLLPETAKGFIPRVPLSISDETLKQALESYVGEGKIYMVKSKSVQEAKGYRNSLITFSDVESFEKAIKRSFFTVNDERLLLREAFESKVNVPIYRAVYSNIPDKVAETTLKKAIESAIGKGSILGLQSSVKNKSVAFVTFLTEEAQLKAVSNSPPIEIGKTVLTVAAFKPRQPKKRGPQRPKKNRKGANLQQTAESSSGNDKAEITPKKEKFKNKSFKKNPGTNGFKKENGKVTPTNKGPNKNKFNKQKNLVKKEKTKKEKN